jgi:cytochrome b
MRGHRPFTYVILAVNALFLIWLITGVGGAASHIQDCSSLAKHAKDLCEAGNAGTAVGTGIGAAIIVFFWGFVDVILGVLWLVTNGRYKAKKAAAAPPVVASAQ